MPSPDNSEQLVLLAQLLSDGRFMTAAQIAIESDCSKSIVKRRLLRLREAGFEFVTQRVREGLSGPKSVAYAIVKAQ